MTEAAVGGERAAPRVVPLALGLGLLAGLSLAYELILIRILSWVHYPQFAGMIISLALLGYGLSGTVLALKQFRETGPGWILACASLFGLAMPLCADFALKLPFNGLALTWDWRQLAYLSGVFGLLSLPFFFAATAIGLTLIRNPRRVGRLYGADLAGAGLGAVLALGLASRLDLPESVLALSALGVGPVALLAWGHSRQRLATLGIPVLLFALVAWLAGYPQIRPSQFKPLSQVLAAKGSRMVWETHGLLGVVSVVQNSEIPLRIAPGLSLMAATVPPAQSALFIDGTDMSGMDAPGSDPSYLQTMPSAVPYAIAAPERVLVLQTGGGQPVRQALSAKASQIDVIAVDKRLEALYQDRSGWAADPAVRLSTSAPRHFLEIAGDRQWDLIVWDNALAPGRPGALGLEDYLLTVEAIQTAWSRLAPDGFLAYSVSLRVPPRAGVKLVWTAARALERAGISEPMGHVFMVRSWNTATLMVGRRPLTAEQVEGAGAFARRLGFDLAWTPDISISEVNRRVRWEQPWLYEAAKAIASGRAGFLESYPFEVRPATDNRPYFENHFRWGVVPQLFEQRREGGLILLEMGYLLVLATLGQALLFGALLVLIPLVAGGAGLRRLPGLGPWSVYFAAVGLGFMAIEIAFIQKLHLLYAHPVQAIGVALASFLVFAGLGGMMAARRTLLRPAVTTIAVICIAYAVLLDRVVTPALGWPEPLQLALAVGLTAPLAFLMGIPFPVGLAELAAARRQGAAWAWGVNGCASVVATPLAVLLAMEIGFRWILTVAGGLYLIAGWVFRPRDAG